MKEEKSNILIALLKHCEDGKFRYSAKTKVEKILDILVSQLAEFGKIINTFCVSHVVQQECMHYVRRKNPLHSTKYQIPTKSIRRWEKCTNPKFFNRS